MRIELKIFLVMLVFLLTGCGSVQIAEELTQGQANQIVAVLNSQGIASQAKRESGGKAKYYVEVKRSFYSQAISIMQQKGLPSPHKPSFSEMIEPKGLLPNSREFEALRLDHALALEIEEMLLAHPGVAAVKTIVRSNSVRDSTESGASVIIQERPGASVSRDDMLLIINRAVPGIVRENIQLSIESSLPDAGQLEQEGVFNADGKVVRVPLAPFIFNWKVPDDDYNVMVIVLVVALVLLGIIGGLIGYWYGYYQYSKNFIDSSLPDTGLRSLRLERPTKDLPEI